MSSLAIDKLRVEPFMAEGQDATKVILEYATNHGTQVYLGLCASGTIL